jgi:regulator of protease activity HflC (stomatin/prohibitin superfamily)
MGLIILGIIILIIGFSKSLERTPLGKFRGLIIIIGFVAGLSGVLLSSVRQVDAGHVGVQVLFGQVQDKVLYEGLNIVNPLVDVQQFSTRTLNYTMSSTSEEGQVMGDDAPRVLSVDGLEVIIDLTILYRVNPNRAPEIYRKIGADYENIIIRPIARTGIRNSSSMFQAIDLFSEKRLEFEREVKSSMQDTLQARGFILDQVLIRKIDLPKSVKESIERKITAVQDAQRMEFVLDKEKREAERKRVEAQGVADAQKIVNEGLSPRILQFEQIKIQRELVNSPNAKIIILGDSKAPPFIINDK